MLRMRCGAACIPSLRVFILSLQWPIGVDWSCVKQHTTLQERLDAAKMLQSKFGLDMPIYVDAMTNQFNKTYACVPFV